MSNQSEVLAFVRNKGSITSLEAINHIGDTRLAATIFVMKEKGHVFDTEYPVKVQNRRGKDCYVARYHYKGQKNKENL
jgi:hypothetical protein|tara:strand:- start:497 stop:730 length:234 start_codon:yes stop_codon:yes gene_type:complete